MHQSTHIALFNKPTAFLTFSPRYSQKEAGGRLRGVLEPQLRRHLQHVGEGHRLVAVVTHGTREEHLGRDQVAVHHHPVHLILHILAG